MIGKAALTLHSQSPPAHVFKKCGWISDPTEGRKAGARPVLLRHRDGKLWKAKHVLEFRRGVKDGAAGVAPDHSLDSGRRRLHASRDYHDVGAPKRGYRFSQASGRQNRSATKRIGGVQKHNVGVARQIQMLKTIVEHKPIGSMPRKDLAIPEAISADTYFYLPCQPRTQERDFVALRLTMRT
jgi:hypothetical protein